MKATKRNHKNWGEVYSIIHNNIEMVITLDLGPRIISFGFKETKNILFTDIKRELFVQDKNWYFYGGHRFWISPETQDTYYSDNEICESNVSEDQLIISKHDHRTKLEKQLIISTSNDSFLVKHVLINNGDLIYTGGIWGLTCVLPTGKVFFPWGGSRRWDLKKIIFWNHWGDNQHSKMNSSQYHPTEDLYIIHPTGEEGKVGTAGYEGFVGITNHEYTFIKKFDRLPIGNYPDDNCAIEVYTCSNFVELETLSPIHTLLPDDQIIHTEEWLLFPKEYDPTDGNSIRKLL
ncbi:MAG: hypothetical protein MJB14_20855 [Spirochaetes bacterium]|nr:hypothetical protein [Spirochaetota bacterium]